VSTGQLRNIQAFTTAAAKAELAVDLTVAVRNRAIEAYQEIMRMQL
jgi:flagellar hook-basal body complex protein FliE